METEREYNNSRKEFILQFWKNVTNNFKNKILEDNVYNMSKDDIDKINENILNQVKVNIGNKNEKLL